MNEYKCKACGATIIWVETQNGRKMPCNAAPVTYQANRRGKDLIVTPNGEVLKGTVVSKDDSFLIVDGYGYISHYATCPNADYFRKK